MDQNNAPKGPMTPVAPKQGSGMGPTLGIIIIVLILAAGGLYMWYTKAQPAPTDGTPSTANERETSPAGMGGPSDTASAIEADLSATDTGNAAGELQLQ